MLEQGEVWIGLGDDGTDLLAEKAEDGWRIDPVAVPGVMDGRRFVVYFMVRDVLEQ